MVVEFQKYRQVGVWIPFAVLLAVTILMAMHVFRSTQLDDDPIRSLGGRSGLVDRVFSNFHQRSFFLNKAFFDVTLLQPAERDVLFSWLAEAGYEPSTAPQADPLEIAERLLVHVPADQIRAKLTPEVVQARGEQLMRWAMLPGGGAFLEQAARDPFGLQELVLDYFAQLLPPRDGVDIRAFDAPPVLSYDRVGTLYDRLVTLEDRVHFIGGDFFSLENYRAIQTDVGFCASLTLILNLILFFLFTRRLVLPGILVAGSALSYVFGFFLVSLFYDKIYAVVLAFTSTFVSFNNEALVHVSGMGTLRDLQWKERAKGVVSALGTTFLGFFVLLFSDSVLIKQMALCALGAMVGFLLFLFCCRDLIARLRFQLIPMPVFPVSRRMVLGLSGAGLVAFAAAPHISTEVERFRFESPTMAAQIKHFQQKLDHARLGEFLAFVQPAAPSNLDAQGEAEGPSGEVGADPLAVFWRSLKKDPGLHPIGFGPHPLDFFKPPEQQHASADDLILAVESARSTLDSMLQAGGVALFGASDSAPQWVDSLRAAASQNASAYLKDIEALTPVRWHDQVDGRWVVYRPIVGSVAAVVPHVSSAYETVVLNPARYYNSMLSDLSVELAVLFLVGLIVMAVYLLVVQRSLWRVLYILTPVLLSVGALAALTSWQGQTLNILHFMGLSLTIALAIDYTSVAVSAHHHSEDLTKVLLTGLSSLVTFGVLIFAEHPVLRTLGVSVALGCGISLVFAVLFPLKAVAR